jgi:predicted transcriptional regulator of viral defense system
MFSAFEKLLDEGLADHAFTERDLMRVIGGTPASRYAIVNKALKKGVLMRLRRGLYFLTPKYHTFKPSQFYAASLIVPYSYISLETALAYRSKG